jgi:dolichol-phosphate mannosyltransferase
MKSSIPNPNAPPLKLLSVIIPARNEEHCIASTVEHLHLELRLHKIPHEIVVVDDSSTESTWAILTKLRKSIKILSPYRRLPPHGFGRAVVHGLDHCRGDAVVIMMADESDDCRDVVRYWTGLNEGYDCVFGSRFSPGGGIIDYPRTKLLINRLANLFIRLLFGVKLNDITNAFKAYRREVIEGCRPLIAPHFNLTVELPLKAIVRGFSWKTIPITWRNRRSGASKLRIKEMGSRYLFICLYTWFEKYFCRGDYNRKPSAGASKPHDTPVSMGQFVREESCTPAEANSVKHLEWPVPVFRNGCERSTEKIGNGGTVANPTLRSTRGHDAPYLLSSSDTRHPLTDSKCDLPKIYNERFKGKESYRNRVWQTLIDHFFQPQIARDADVLDLGCGYGEFINNIRCGARFGMDLNPNTAALLSPEVCFLRQDCSTQWNLPDASLDVVFASNFFEHLPDKKALAATLDQTRRCLRPGGRLIVMGPNIRFIPGAYWDFWDHYLPLTDRSMEEGLRVHGFKVIRRIERFLPYTMATGVQYPPILLRNYLEMPLLWRLLGKQFLLIAQTGVMPSSNHQEPSTQHPSLWETLRIH